MKKKTLSDWMSELGSSKSDKKIASSMRNLERANKARKLKKEMADRRGAKLEDMEIVLNKKLKEWKNEYL